MRLSYDPSKIKKNHLFILIDGIRINKGNDNELSDEQFFALEKTKFFQDLEKKEAIKIIGRRPRKAKTETKSESESNPSETESKNNKDQLTEGKTQASSKAKK